MAFVVTDTGNIEERVKEKSKELGSGFGIWKKNGSDGKCVLRVVPCEVEEEPLKDNNNSKKITRLNWVVRFHFRPEFFDFSDIDDIVEDVFVPMRKRVKQAVLFFQGLSGDEPGIKTYWIMTANAYREGDEDDPRPRSERKRELSAEYKEELLQEAIEEMLDFFVAHAKPDVLQILENKETLCKPFFE